MQMKPFKLECYFGLYEFTAPYLLTQSDCESMTAAELLALEPGAQEGYLNQWLGYTETWGDPELRRLIAGLYQNMEDKNILVFHGAQEAIFAYMNVLLEPGDHMIVMYPNYQSAYEVANSIPNCSYSKWYLKDAGDRWTIDFDELEKLIQPNTKVIAVNSPNNPTGYTFTNAEIQRLCQICKERDIYLFADEVGRSLRQVRLPGGHVQGLRPGRPAGGLAGRQGYGVAGPYREVQALHEHLRLRPLRVPVQGGPEAQRPAAGAQPHSD